MGITSVHTAGSGIGTYSAQLIAEAHGGSITLETSEENGTTLAIVLPLLQTHN